MADSSMQYSGSRPLTMEKIEQIVGSALHNSSTILDSGALKDSSSKPPVSLSHSHILSSNAACSSNIGNYQHSDISNSLDRPFSSTCCHEPNMSTNSVMDKYYFDDLKKEMPDSSDEWVDYQFNRLVMDRKGLQKPPSTMENKLSSRFDSSNNQKSAKSKNVEDLIREYSINPPYTSDAMNSSIMKPLPKSCRLSSAITDRQYRSDWMNRSHNNEYLDTSNSEAEQVRRIGSSVDGKVGDVSELSQKCSLTNGRCRTPVSSSMQLHTTVSEGYKDYKHLPDRVPSDSEVDLKEPTSQTSGKDYSEIRSEMADISYSFQKEIDRLRHIETLIKKTPRGNTMSSTTAYFQPKLNNRYSSRFLTDLTERRAYSSTDYSSRFVTTDWRSSSPHRDYIGKTISSPSYKNFTTTMPRTNYWSDYSAMQEVNAGYETSRAATSNPHVYETEMGKQQQLQHQHQHHQHQHHQHQHQHQHAAHGKYQYNDVSESRYANSKSKLNRSMNARKDKTSSKTTGSQKQRQKVSSRSSHPSKTISQKERGFDQSDNRKNQFAYDNVQSDYPSNYENRPATPSTSSNSSKDGHSGKGAIPKRKSANKPQEDGRYKSYQPLDLGRYYPQQTKSETSSLDTSCHSAYVAQNYAPPQHVAQNYAPPQKDKHWLSMLGPPTNNPIVPATKYEERIGRPMEPSYRNVEETQPPRSRSNGMDKPITLAWIDDNTNPIELLKKGKSISNRSSSRGKKMTRKHKVGGKPKKMGRSVSRHKKRVA